MTSVKMAHGLCFASNLRRILTKMTSAWHGAIAVTILVSESTMSFCYDVQLYAMDYFYLMLFWIICNLQSKAWVWAFWSNK